MSIKQTAITCAAIAALTLAATTAQAVTLFSQTPTIVNGIISDVHNQRQAADELTLATTATARKVTWRGFFASYGTPTYPVTFNIVFYGNNSSDLPNRNNILSTTTVSYNAIGDFTLTGNRASSYDEYEFEANINPVLLTAGTKVWFSVYADTRNDGDDFFYWTVGGNTAIIATSSGVTASDRFFARPIGSLYFILDDTANPSAVGPYTTAVPEPASLTLAMLGLGGLAITTRRRRREV